MIRLRLGIPVLAVVFLCSLASAQDEELPLTNWGAPPYWQPSPDTESVSKMPRRLALAGLSSPMPFVAIEPCRVVDTRGNGFTGEWGPPALSAQATRSITIAGQCGIPMTAQAVSFQFTAVNMTSNGNFRSWPGGSGMPTASVLNWTATQGVAGNGIVVPIGGGGVLNVYLNGPLGSTVNLVLDVNGYYAPQGIVNSLNTLSGDLTIAGGNNVTVTPSGQTLSIAATIPAGAGVYGTPGDTTLLNQGYTEVVPFDREVWAPTSLTNVPAGRFWHCSVWTGTKMFVWGGQDSSQVPVFTSGGLYDPATDSWTATSTSGDVPTARRYHRCVWTGSEVLVWGGEDASVIALNTGSRYNPVGNSWTAMSTSSAPAGRFSAAVVWAAEASPPRMLVWGGLDRHSGNVYPADGGAYNPVGDTWSPLSTTSQPTPRAGPVFIWTGAKLVLWGGYIGSGTCLDTGGRYDPATDTWSSTAAAGLSARYAASAVWTGSRMIVWGGSCASRFGDGALYDPEGDAWTPMTNTGAPTARYNQVAVWTGSRMIVWSGMADPGPAVTNTGGIYNPVSNTWRTMTTTNAPVANYGYIGHWTGLPLNEMVVWGGYTSAGGTYRTLSLFIKN